MRRLIALTLLAALGPCASASAAWAPPVRGAPTRLFRLGANPFVAGQHRGVDLAATSGERVLSACGGTVRFAGPVAGTGTVSVTCGRWRVSYAPLDRIAVRAHRRVGQDQALGTVAREPRAPRVRAGRLGRGHIGGGHAGHLRGGHN